MMGQVLKTLVMMSLLMVFAQPTSADDFAFRERFKEIFSSKYRNGSSLKIPTKKIEMAFGSNYGTQGAEVAFVAGFNQKFSVSFAANTGDKKEASQNTANISGNFTTKYKMAGVDTDLRFHPWQNGFFTSLGFRINRNEMSKSISLSGNETIKLYGQTYGAHSIRHLSFNKSYNPIAPRLMLGFDNSVHTKRRYGLHLAFGVLYQGKGKQTYNVQYANNLNPLTNATLPDRIAEANLLGINSSFDRSVVPIVSAGVKIRF